MEHRPVSAHMGIPARHKGASAGGADRILAEGMAERDGIGFHQCIQIGRNGGGIAKVTHDITAPLIRVKDNNMGFVAHENNYPIDGWSITHYQMRYHRMTQ